MLPPRDTRQLIAAAGDAGLLDVRHADALLEAHAQLLSLGLACTLDRRPRITAEVDLVQPARVAIGDAARATGLDFGIAG